MLRGVVDDNNMPFDLVNCLKRGLSASQRYIIAECLTSRASRRVAHGGVEGCRGGTLVVCGGRKGCRGGMLAARCEKEIETRNHAIHDNR